MEGRFAMELVLIPIRHDSLLSVERGTLQLHEFSATISNHCMHGCICNSDVHKIFIIEWSSFQQSQYKCTYIIKCIIMARLIVSIVNATYVPEEVILLHYHA